MQAARIGERKLLDAQGIWEESRVGLRGQEGGVKVIAAAGIVGGVEAIRVGEKRRRRGRRGDVGMCVGMHAMMSLLRDLEGGALEHGGEVTAVLLLMMQLLLLQLLLVLLLLLLLLL